MAQSFRDVEGEKKNEKLFVEMYHDVLLGLWYFETCGVKKKESSTAYGTHMRCYNSWAEQMYVFYDDSGQDESLYLYRTGFIGGSLRIRTTM